MKSFYSAIIAALLSATGVFTGAEAHAFKVIHTFEGWQASDGALPFAPLVLDQNGNLFGTTVDGGLLPCSVYPQEGCGVVFELTAQNTEKILYEFGSSRQDANNPYGGVVKYGDKFFGVSPYSEGGGAAYSIKKNEKEKYQSGLSGMTSWGTLVALNGQLYGTTDDGGAGGKGTIFAIDPKTLANSTVYSFCSEQNCIDGDFPLTGLIDVDGVLYGTTAIGGSNDDGTVFSFDPVNGDETVLYSFSGGSKDGGGPSGRLLADKLGNLYGTTDEGGGMGCGGLGCGTVYKLDADGIETILYAFQGGKDGGGPQAGLIADKIGDLYGTTFGGGGNGCLGSGCGTVFELSPKGVETVLYSFSGGSDGADPMAPLVFDADGNLFGTAAVGGDPTNCLSEYGWWQGCGTVFEITK